MYVGLDGFSTKNVVPTVLLWSYYIKPTAQSASLHRIGCSETSLGKPYTTKVARRLGQVLPRESVTDQWTNVLTILS